MNGDLDPFYRDFNFPVISLVHRSLALSSRWSLPAPAASHHSGAGMAATGFRTLVLFVLLHGLLTAGVSGVR